MVDPEPIRPDDFAVFNPDKMGKNTIFRSERVMVGINAFEPGQEHRIHSHEGMDKVYHVLSGRGEFTVGQTTREMDAGMMVVAPDGVPHGVRNTSGDRLVVLAVLAPAP